MRLDTLACLGLLLLLVPSPAAWARGQDSRSGDSLRRTLPDGGWSLEEIAKSSDGTWLPQGDYKRYDSEGRLRISGSYDSGLASGTWIWRNEQGEPAARGNFEGGKRTGSWTFFWPTGKERAAGHYVGSTRVGAWSYFDPDGTPIRARNGERTHVEGTSPESKIRFEGTLVDGVFEGPWAFSWPNGGTMLLAQFEGGRRTGDWRFYLPDGTRDDALVKTEYGGDNFESWIDFAPEPEDLLPLSVERIESIQQGRVHPGDSLDPFVGTLPHQQEDMDTAAVLRRAVDGSGRDRKIARNLLELAGADVLTPCVELLLSLDLANSSDATRGAWVVREILGPTAHRNFEWSDETFLRSQATNQRSLARIVAFVRLISDAPWALDLELAWSPPAPLPLSPSVWTSGTGVERRLEASDNAAIRLVTSPPSPREGRPLWVHPCLADGLAWLAAHQEEDGHWSASAFTARCRSTPCRGPGYPTLDTGVTALALLAFLRAEERPAEGPYADRIARGIGYLLAHTDPDTGQIGEGASQWRIMEQALGLSVFSEALASVDSPALRRAGAKAVAYLDSVETPYSGWRYSVPPDGTSDTAVTALVLQALYTARAVGIEVSEWLLEGGLAWIDEATDFYTGRVGYDARGTPSSRYPFNEEVFPERREEAMTAIAIWVRFLGGLDLATEGNPSGDGPTARGLELLEKCPPEAPSRDGLRQGVFYWTFGAYAEAAAGGYGSHRWRAALHSVVPELQSHAGHEAGSWDPDGPWGAVGGRVYSTAMMCLLLEAIR